MRSDRHRERPLLSGPAFLALAAGAVALSACAPESGEARADATVAAVADSCSVWTEFRGVLGAGNAKIRTEGEQVFVWAGGDESGPGAEWYDFTGSDSVFKAGPSVARRDHELQPGA